MSETPIGDPTPVEPGPSTTAEFHRIFGYSVTMWNRAEKSLRDLLAGMIAGEMPSTLLLPQHRKALILTAELGTTGVKLALKAFAQDTLQGEAQASVLHLIKYFEIVLAYRNHYVHGITYVMNFSGEKLEDLNHNPTGLINHTTAKGKVLSYEDYVTIAELEQFWTWCGVLANFATGITFSLLFPAEFQPVPLPDKPVLPPELKKTPRRYPTASIPS